MTLEVIHLLQAFSNAIDLTADDKISTDIASRDPSATELSCWSHY